MWFHLDAQDYSWAKAGVAVANSATGPFQYLGSMQPSGQMLRDMCRHLGVSEGIMQMGHMRFEPNINVIITRGNETFATPIVEIKNLNSFKAVHGAIEHEYERQIDEWIETGRTMGARTKSTRGWDDNRGVTFLQREKEDADEYRYFPDPDLVEVIVEHGWLESLKADMPELPWVRRQRYVETFGLSPVDARTLTDEPATTRFFEDVIDAGADAKKAAALLLNDGLKEANARGNALDQVGVSPGQVAAIIQLAVDDQVSSAGASKLFALCCEPQHAGADVMKLAESQALLQVSDTGALAGYIDQVLADPKNAPAIDDIRAGKGKAIGALIGQIMKLSKGAANPKVITAMIRERLGE